MTEEIKGFQGEYRWLSNMWPCKVIYKGKEFPSSEHAYVFSKLREEERNDEEMYTKLVNLSPRESKKWGQLLTIRPNFDRDKLGFMEDILLSKFQENPELREKLLSTGDCYIEELNDWHDVWWGVCDGKGKNHLGKLLMHIRTSIKMENILGNE